jgi:L-rhamnose isomerase
MTEQAMANKNKIEKAYELASERYAELNVDTNQAIKSLADIPLSLHCWQGDDVGGFENPGGELTGGIAATGNYPGKARTADELRLDLDKAFSLIPGNHRLNLHAIYLESRVPVERNAILPEHFQGWVEWAKEKRHGLDFNPTLFSHPMAANGFTLSSADPTVRRYWIEHCIACRKIGAYFGQELKTPCITNIWIPDGFKDNPYDRKTPRLYLKESLDEIFSEKLDKTLNLDAVEGKLFGLGAESYTTGSHEFYLGYAVANQLLLCLDAGHFHPTESIADKLSSVLAFLDEVILHVSRGVRWDSDHVVIHNDDLVAIAQEIVRGNYWKRVHIGLDYFDASINRIAAWVVGSRATLRALLIALLEPQTMLRQIELSGDYTQRLALFEELKGLPFGAVWDYYCYLHDVPIGFSLMKEIQAYEHSELALRV